MAFKKTHTVNISYRVGLDNLAEQFEGILSEQDLQLVKQPVLRTFDVVEAYHRVEQIHATKEQIEFKLAIYNSDITRLITAQKYSFVPDVSENSINYHTQCYNYAKSLPEFADLIDC